MTTPIEAASSAPIRPRKFKRWLLVILIIALPLLYFLSAGPALLMAQRRMIATEKVEAFLSPLEFATAMIPGAERLMHSYLMWWESLTPVPQNHDRSMRQ
jgi:hypothetical protein